MKNFYNFRLQETLGEQILNRLIQRAEGLEESLLEKIKQSLKDFSLQTIEAFFEQYNLAGVDSGMLSDLQTNKDLMDFYNDNQENFDEYLLKNNWFEKSPAQNQIYSLKEYYYEAIKFAINTLMQELQKNLLEDED